MRLDEACEATFARHETFHPRHGWFRKAFLAASRDRGAFFLSEDAPVRLGVGKNMVRSIRFWGIAAHLVAEASHPDGGRLHYTRPTNFGVGLLGSEGLDPYMENPATWWWLHWMLHAPTSLLPAWWIVLNEMNAVEFDADLAERVCAEVISASIWEPPHPSSIHKDVGAFLRTYARGKEGGRARFDDQFGCPLQDLRLVTISSTGYRLATGRPQNLPGEVVLAALLDYVSLTTTGASTASLARLATTPGAPGRIFRMTEDSLVDLVTPVIAGHKSLSLSAPAGAIQIGWRGDPSKLAHRLLCDYFGREPDAVAAVAGPEARLANLDPLVELRIIQDSLEVVL